MTAGITVTRSLRLDIELFLMTAGMILLKRLRLDNELFLYMFDEYRQKSFGQHPVRWTHWGRRCMLHPGEQISFHGETKKGLLRK
jgi:hypothetical protein